MMQRAAVNIFPDTIVSAVANTCVLTPFKESFYYQIKPKHKTLIAKMNMVLTGLMVD